MIMSEKCRNSKKKHNNSNNSLTSLRTDGGIKVGHPDDLAAPFEVVLLVN